METQTKAVRTRTGNVAGKRGARTRELILTELAAHLQKKTVAEVTVADVARGVQCSTAAFYQYFRNIKAAAQVLALDCAATGEPLPDGLVDQRTRADALAAELAKPAAYELSFDDLPTVIVHGIRQFEFTSCDPEPGGCRVRGGDHYRLVVNTTGLKAIRKLTGAEADELDPQALAEAGA